VIDIALSAAVPLWIEKVRHMTPKQRGELALLAARTIAWGEKNDETRGQHGAGPALLVSGECACGLNVGGPAAVFNAMAAGLALVAYQPGGADFQGQHWEVKP
jgi:hypothetical protein